MELARDKPFELCLTSNIINKYFVFHKNCDLIYCKELANRTRHIILEIYSRQIILCAFALTTRDFLARRFPTNTNMFSAPLV